MDYSQIEILEPKEFFHWFCAINRIPHGSRKEGQLIAFIQDFAKKRNLTCETDEMGNIMVRVPATIGYESEPSVLLQAHMDMVCNKEPDVDFDFNTQPLDMYIDGNLLRARGTTLGADNAVGMATMLALADASDIPHPALELLFTVQEEIGLIGIRHYDMTKIQSRRMINMDCGDSHVLCVSSAGKIAGEIRKEFAQAPVPANYEALKLSLSGGLGGHGGISANKSRGCGGNILGDLLIGLDEYLLCSMYGNNPIIKSAEAVIALPKERIPKAVDILESRFQLVRKVYQNTDPDWTLEITPCDLPELSVSQQDSNNITAALMLLRGGQYRCDGNDPTIIITSGLMSHFSLKAGKLLITYGLRSANDGDQELLFQRYQWQMRQLGLELKETDRYTGWLENPISPMRETRSIYTIKIDIRIKPSTRFNANVLGIQRSKKLLTTIGSRKNNKMDSPIPIATASPMTTF